MKRIFRNGRYANVTATLALIVALGGTSYAAITLPRNSVGSKQIKKRAVTNSKLRPNAVTTSKVKDGSLRAKDFKAGDLPAGPAGATNVVIRTAGNPSVPAGERGKVIVPCHAGEKAISGGLAVRGQRQPASPVSSHRGCQRTARRPGRATGRLGRDRAQQRRIP